MHSELSETDVDFVLLSDAAQVAPDGKLHLIGGGLAWLSRAVPAVPDVAAPPTSFAIVVSFRIGWNDTNTDFPLRIAITDLDSTNTLFEMTAQVRAGRPPHLSSGDSVYVPLAIPVLAHFPKGGHYVVRAALQYGKEERVRTVRFTVVDLPIASAPPPAG